MYSSTPACALSIRIAGMHVVGCKIRAREVGGRSRLISGSAVAETEKSHQAS